MSKIKIKNFGPIKEGYADDGGFMDVKKVTVFIGNQGSGKSTVAKVISTMIWLEKAINRGDVKILDLTKSDFFDFFEYQRIHNYLQENSEIEYVGEKLSIKYNKNLAHPEVTWKTGHYSVPKIMYVPSERNFLSVVKNAYGLKNLPDTLYTFAEELRKGQMELNDKLLDLPVGDLRFKYKKENGTSYLIGKDFELDLTESSSGYQSLVPLYLVTKFLSDELHKSEDIIREQLTVEQSVRRKKEITDIIYNLSLSDLQRHDEVEEINKKYFNTCLINIVEEPEQNLYPTSQHQILNNLLAFNNMNPDNQLIMTTHSPYLINYLTLAVKANELEELVKSDDLKIRLNKIVPLNSTINPNDLVIYELDEKIGSIKKLGNYNGIPSDSNFLNKALGKGNQQFDSLLEIEEEL